MKATLIEIDHNCHPRYWYARYAGQRLWCTPGREPLAGECWVVIPGQGIPAETEAVIWAEHAWIVREGEVQPVLREVEPTMMPMSLNAGQYP